MQSTPCETLHPGVLPFILSPRLGHPTCEIPHFSNHIPVSQPGFSSFGDVLNAARSACAWSCVPIEDAPRVNGNPVWGGSTGAPATTLFDPVLMAILTILDLPQSQFWMAVHVLRAGTTTYLGSPEAAVGGNMENDAVAGTARVAAVTAPAVRGSIDVPIGLSLWSDETLMEAKPIHVLTVCIVGLAMTTQHFRRPTGIIPSRRVVGSGAKADRVRAMWNRAIAQISMHCRLGPLCVPIPPDSPLASVGARELRFHVRLRLIAGDAMELNKITQVSQTACPHCLSSGKSVVVQDAKFFGLLRAEQEIRGAPVQPYVHDSRFMRSLSSRAAVADTLVGLIDGGHHPAVNNNLDWSQPGHSIVPRRPGTDELVMRMARELLRRHGRQGSKAADGLL